MRDDLGADGEQDGDDDDEEEEEEEAALSVVAGAVLLYFVLCRISSPARVAVLCPNLGRGFSPRRVSHLNLSRVRGDVQMEQVRKTLRATISVQIRDCRYQSKSVGLLGRQGDAKTEDLAGKTRTLFQSKSTEATVFTRACRLKPSCFQCAARKRQTSAPNVWYVCIPLPTRAAQFGAEFPDDGEGGELLSSLVLPRRDGHVKKRAPMPRDYWIVERAAEGAKPRQTPYK